jgi:hypothetical protein
METLQKLLNKLDEPAQALLVTNEDYVRKHKQVISRHDDFLNQVNGS